ncbi:NrsF family protein [Bradyrhizobium oligotrophicum]|uniref:NrsF family protein n=1 Tax=Bradyrhizobium TaxID=374 RepID=UPI003EB6CC4C
MDTDQLIRTLAADNAQRAQPVGIVLALALMAATPVSTAMLLIGLGVRPDIWLAVRNPFFDLKFVVTTALAIPALIISLHLSRPEASLQGWSWLLIAPIVVLVGGMAAEMMLPQRTPMMARLVGHNSMVCMSAIPVLSLPLLGAALFGLRHGAPSRPAMTGAIAGLVSAGMAATLYAAHCTDDSPFFVATWYTVATLIVAGLGALIGARVLRY